MNHSYNNKPEPPYRLLDDLNSPGGYDETDRPVWLVSDRYGDQHWAYIEREGDYFWIAGFANFGFERVPERPKVIVRHRKNNPTGSNSSSGLIAGAGVGGLLGGAIGGPAGAAVGAFIGGILGAAGGQSKKS